MTIPKKILLVDDDPHFAAAISSFLNNLTYSVVIADTGKKALEMLKAESIDLVLLDDRLPDAYGLNLIQPLHEIKGDLAILLMTGAATVDHALQALKLGAADYLAKPFNPKDLVIRIEKSINFVSLQNELDYYRSRQDPNYPAGFFSLPLPPCAKCTRKSWKRPKLRQPRF